MRRHPDSEQGFVLIAAIWLLLLCAVMVAVLMLRGHDRAVAAADASDRLKARLVLESAVETVVADILFNGQASRAATVPASLLRYALPVLVALALLPTSSVLAQAVASPFTSATRYDLERRVVGKIAADPDGTGPLPFLASRNSYDGDGRLTRAETGTLSTWQAETVAPASWSGFTVTQLVDSVYDLGGNKIRDTVSAGGQPQSVTQYSYDGIGRVTCTAVRMNPAAWASLPADACTLGTEGTAGPDRITRNTYIAAYLTQVEKAVGTPIAQTYAAYTYAANGKLSSMTDANGNRAQMTYDALDRQQRWIFPSKTTVGQVNTADYEEYTYDLAGNRTSLRKRDGQLIGYSYDALNRVTAKTWPNTSLNVAYTYDARGLQTAAAYPNGLGTSAGYDSAGRLWRQDDSSGGWDRGPTYAAFDANGNRTSLSFGGRTILYEYDGLDRIGPADVDVVGKGIGVVRQAARDDLAGRAVTKALGHVGAGAGAVEVLRQRAQPARSVIGVAGRRRRYAARHRRPPPLRIIDELDEFGRSGIEDPRHAINRTASSSNSCEKPFCSLIEFTFHRKETLHFIGANPLSAARTLK